MSRGRRPINLEMKGLKDNRQRVWEVLRAERDGITGTEIAERAEVEISTVRLYLRSLQRAGYIEPVVQAGLFEVRPWRLIKDCGAEAPALTRDGKPSTRGRVNEAMWRSLRILGEVSAEELAQQASVAAPASFWTAHNYLRWLHWAGYVVISVPSTIGRKGSRPRYSLIPGKYTGPKPPMVQRNGQLYDPNLGAVVYVHKPAAQEAAQA